MNSMLVLNWLAGIILLAHAIWKLAAIVLAAVLLVLSSATATGWWLDLSDRDAARAALVQEQGVSEQLRASISEQNHAIDGMAKVA